MTRTRSSGLVPGVRAASGLAAMVVSIPIFVSWRRLHLQLVEVALQAVEALLPELPIALQPAGGVLQRGRVEPAGAPLGLAAARDQPGALQHLEMLGDGGQADVAGPGPLRTRRLPPAHTPQDT